MKKKVLSLLLVGAMTASLLAGCGSSKTDDSASTGSAAGTESAEAGDVVEGYPTEIDMNEDPYQVAIQVVTLPGSDFTANEEAMEEAINAITLPEINCTVDIQFVWISEVANTTSLAIAGDEKVDLLHVATVSPLSSMVGSDMLLDMNEDNLLQNRGTELVNLFSDILQSGNVDGAQLAVPAKIYNAVEKGFYYNKTVTDAAGITVPETGTIDDLEAMLYAVKEKNPDIMSWYLGEGKLNFLYWLEGYDGFGSECSYGAILDAEKSLTVENIYASETFKNYALRMLKWRQDGIITKDTTDTTSAQDYMGAQQLVATTGDLTPELRASYTSQGETNGYETGYCSIVPSKISNSSVTEYMWGIASNSERPDKAMDFLNFLYSNTDVANILKYGIEGTNYDVVGDNQVAINGSYLPVFYQGGNVNAMYVQAPADATYIDEWKALQNQATISPILGYMFNDADYQTEAAVISNVIVQYLPTLQSGMCGTEEDTLAYIDEFVAALEAAGINDVIAGNQAQLDAYVSAQ